MNAGSPLNEIMALRAALTQAEARADAAEADAAQAKAKASSDQAFIAYLKLEIEKLRRDLYGVRSERKARLLDQLELQLEELEATTSEDELAAEQAAAKTTAVETFSRRKPVRKPFPDHLPRERVVVPAPTSCPCCGSDKLCKLGETARKVMRLPTKRFCWIGCNPLKMRIFLHHISHHDTYFARSPRLWVAGKSRSWFERGDIGGLEFLVRPILKIDEGVAGRQVAMVWNHDSTLARWPSP